ncbi:MAG: hypothetical protein M3Q48_03485, partial [Actinomycetota bacterium]|nr:hypothetical protein [Actinomycetota bacterium]
PSRDELTKAWGDLVLASLGGRAKARFGAGRFVAVDDAAVFAVPNEHYLGRCQEVRAEVEAALSGHFGRPVPLRLVVDRQGPGESSGSSGGHGHDPGPGMVEDYEDLVDLDRSHDAAATVTSPEDRLKQAFPGAEEVSP